MTNKERRSAREAMAVADKRLKAKPLRSGTSEEVPSNTEYSTDNSAQEHRKTQNERNSNVQGARMKTRPPVSDHLDSPHLLPLSSTCGANTSELWHVRLGNEIIIKAVRRKMRTVKIPTPRCTNLECKSCARESITKRSKEVSQVLRTSDT